MPLKPPPPGLQPLRDVRVRALLAQRDLAERIDERQDVISRLETGLLVPTAQQLARLCKVLKAKPIELFSRTVLAEVERRTKVSA